MLKQNLCFYGYRFSGYTKFLIGINNLKFEFLETKSCVINRILTNLT